jgi:hypothetical protein
VSLVLLRVKEARSFLLTEKFLQAMLTDASQDNTLAQEARVATAAAAAIAPKSQNLRRYRFPLEQAAAPFQQTTRYDGIQGSRGGRGGRGRKVSRGRGQRHNAGLQGGRRYVYLNPDPLASSQDDPKPPSHSLSNQARTFNPTFHEGGTAPMGVASRLKSFASHWASITDDIWVLKTVSEGLRLEFTAKPVQKFFPPEISMSDEMTAICDQEVDDLLFKQAITEITEGSDGFVCSFFCIKKKQAGKFRPIVNLNLLNILLNISILKWKTSNRSVF